MSLTHWGLVMPCWIWSSLVQIMTGCLFRATSLRHQRDKYSCWFFYSGLEEHELRDMLSRWKRMEDHNRAIQILAVANFVVPADAVIPMAIFTQLLRSLQGFFRPVSKEEYVYFLCRNIRFVIWVRSWRCGSLFTWFCYHLIAKPGNKTAAPSWSDPYSEHCMGMANSMEEMITSLISIEFM